MSKINPKAPKSKQQLLDEIKREEVKLNPLHVANNEEFMSGGIADVDGGEMDDEHIPEQNR